MSISLHIDLLREEERFGSSPVRLRVMAPLLVFLCALGIGVWWSLFAFRAHNQSLLKNELVTNIAELKSAHNQVLLLRAQEKELTASLKQLTLYKNSRVTFGETFEKLTACVPASVQLTELRVPPPIVPVVAPSNPAPGPTNKFDRVTLRVAGRSGSSGAVDALLLALRKPAFTNLIASAEIPKGAFRQDGTRNPSTQETLLFEITCECIPRRFE